MPQIVFAMMAGAGLYAASRLLGKMLESQADLARRQAENRSQQRTDAAVGPRDLGALVWDDQAGVYRPQSPTQH
jgi:hypothetical protein